MEAEGRVHPPVWGGNGPQGSLRNGAAVARAVESLYQGDDKVCLGTWDRLTWSLPFPVTSQPPFICTTASSAPGTGWEDAWLGRRREELR